LDPTQTNIVDKLALQVDSFHEGFKILSESKSINEMAKQFASLVRGNFLVTDVNLFYKEDSDSSWQMMYGKREKNIECMITNNSKRMQIEYELNEDVKACVNLPLVDNCAFGITIGAKLDKSEFTEFDKITLQIFLQLLDNAYQSFQNRQTEKNLIFELNQRVLQLNNLIDTGIDLSKFENRKLLFELALQRAVVLTDTSHALVLINKDEETIEEILFPPGIESSVVTGSENKISASFTYQGKEYIFTLANKESRAGAAEYTDLDILLLEAIARQVNAALENDFLHQESLIKERIEGELNVAATIQQRVIPRELPVIPGYDVAGINIPSREVGGDYYDCVDLGDDKFALVMADVAGKGIAAALLVNTLNASLYAYLDNRTPLPEMADKLNKIIYNASPPDKFITYFITILDAKTGELDIVNAGHNPILLLREDGAMQKIEAGGVGLGMFDFGIPYKGEKQTINTDERLFLYTDGIPEAMNKTEDEYSDERMEEFFLKNKTNTAQEFVDKIVTDVKSFTGNAEQSDDITVLYLIRKS
jgi:sigma-B regulation protein RsbU (phosphoserine phosphatase)